MPKSHTQTGRALGKTALRHQRKNAEVVDEYLLLAKAAADADTLARSLDVETLEIAKVVAPRGAGRIEVTKSDGTTENVRIAGAVKFHGKAGNKADRDNCMVAGSHVVIRGGQASARIPSHVTEQLRDIYTKLAVPTAKKFFEIGVQDVADAAADDGFEFDYGGAEAAAAEVDIDAI
jgi:hypothetical protein